MSDETALIITRGERAEFDIFLEKKTLPRSMDLSGFDKFKVCFDGDIEPFTISEIANANGSIVTPIAGGIYGQLKVTLEPADTLKLKAQFGQDLDIECDNAATPNPKRKRLKKVLHVEDSICD